jgi:hypothetical protein
MWQKPHLVLHIGPHKTGSTAIQEFCSTHRGDLAEAGYWYPFAARWDIHHAVLPAAYMHEHAFLPAELVGQDPGALIDSLRADAPPGFRVILSSEIFWELLMNDQAAFHSMLARLRRFYNVTLVYFDRPEGDQAWSAVKHLTRSGFAEDAAEKYAFLIAENRAANKRLQAIRVRRIAIPYGGDSVTDFVSALAGLTATDQLLNRRERSQAFRKLADSLRESRQRVNAALEHPKAVAFTFEFARRLAHDPPASAEARRYLEWFLWKVLQMAEPLGQWSMLPSERVMRDRTVRANGRRGSLLTQQESVAWTELCEHDSVRQFVERGRCGEILDRCVRRGPSASNTARRTPTSLEGV